MIMTPMTKRIFSCFILYFYNDLNGIILYGKSGSGKTETVKYFAKKLGRKIFVYCCDEKTNITILDEILTKCAKTDSFLCLDEFNRLNAETMSTMHKLISKYKKSCKTKIYLFCTMNLGYKGRFNLPKSLLNIFGSIRVDQPDMKEIAEYYEKENSTLLVKIFEILSLKFSQYDFGIRALKTVLKIYKNIFSILKNKNKNENYNIISNENLKNIRKESLNLIRNYIDECLINDHENLNDSSIYDKKSFKKNNEYYLMLSILLYTCPMLISNEKQFFNEIINKFFDEKIPSIDFKHFCLYNKRGIILVGKCNTGKSSFIIEKFKEKKFYCNPYTTNLFESEKFANCIKNSQIIIFDCKLESS
ncbi:dynein heavy chain [Gurleya vavrai]